MYRISVSLWLLLFWQFSFAFGMAGRPHNRNMIVDNVCHNIPVIKLKALSAITSDASTTLEFLASYGLVHNTMHYTRCDMAMVYSSRSDSFDGKCWYCSHCKCRKSIWVDSFFSHAKLSMTTVVDLMYWWSIDVQQSIVLEEVGLSNHTIVDWYNFFREICRRYFTAHPVQLGGPGTVVEIDESKFLGWYSEIVDSVVWFRCRTKEQPLYCPSFVSTCFRVHA